MESILNSNIDIRIEKKLPDFSLSVDLTLPGSGITALFGVSGSGKTTLLRCIAGLEKAESAMIRFSGIWWQHEEKFIPTAERRLGYIFQEPSLFPHLTVKENLAFGQKKKDSAAIQTESVRLGIEHLLTRYPSSLSGGERQRVAIARTLLSRPSVLLMDEPLAALDYQRKQEILPYLKHLKEQLNIPIIYVSHAIDEVIQLADHLVLLEKGKVLADGQLIKLLAIPDIASKLGQKNKTIFSAKIVEHCHTSALTKIKIDELSLWVPLLANEIGQKISCRLCTNHIHLSAMPDAVFNLNQWPMKLAKILPSNLAGFELLELQRGKTCLYTNMTSQIISQADMRIGMQLWVTIPQVEIVSSLSD